MPREAVADLSRDAIDDRVMHQAARDVHGTVRARLEDAELGRVGAAADR
jgi:hypothetical protein